MSSEADKDKELLVERDARGIVTLTLNRPHKLNAMTKSL